MAVDPVALLKVIAKQHGKAVRSLYLFDSTVCKSPTHPDRPWEHLPIPGDFFCHKTEINFGGHKVRLRANGEFFVVEIRGDFDVDVLSIKGENEAFQLEARLLQIPGLTEAVSALRLEKTERLHIYRSGPILYLKPDSIDEALLAVEALCSFIEKLPSFNDSVNLDGLPPKFKELSRFIYKWAVSDDELRTEMLEQKSEAALRKFVSAVEPHIPSINEYLASFREEAPSEAACALGTLAECATEARIILDKAKS